MVSLLSLLLLGCGDPDVTLIFFVIREMAALVHPSSLLLLGRWGLWYCLDLPYCRGEGGLDAALVFVAIGEMGTLVSPAFLFPSGDVATLLLP